MLLKPSWFSPKYVCEEAPFLPKIIWGYFAEFIRESCLVPLCILYLPIALYMYPFVKKYTKLDELILLNQITKECPETQIF